MPSIQFTLLTPTFTAGVDQTHPELRVPSIKGQLRWWTRAVLGRGEPEYDLFGGIQGTQNGYEDNAVAGPFVFRLATPRVPTAKSPLCPHDPPRREGGHMVGKGERDALIPTGTEVFELRWFSRLPRAAHFTADLQRVVDTWLLLGSVGCRSNRAAGSVWRTGYQPDVATFEQHVVALKLKGHLAVRVIGEAVQKPDDLREVATDTLQGRPPQTGNIRNMVLGDVFGYVAGNDRKASPLKLKVGHFAEGYRLIAVFDMRDGRATADQFTGAIRALKNANKRLGVALEAVLSERPLIASQGRQ